MILTLNLLIICISVFAFSILFNFLSWKFWNFKKLDFLRSIIKSDRWGTQRVPLTGGIVIVTITTGCIIYFNICLILPIEFLIAACGGILMFILGLIDDLFELKSYKKFIGQIIIIFFVVTFGVRAKLFGNILDIIVTFFWFLGITNAFNLMDNMDGLAGGIAIIASLFLAMEFIQDGNVLLYSFSLIFASVLVGFLILNFRPAKIYLGDNGSLFIGFMLSALTVLGTQSSGKSLFGVIVFPVILLLIPIFDTIMVSVTRKIRGQSPFQGGRDHLSHRLVKLGMTETQAVLFLYFVSIILGLSIFILKEVSIFAAILIYFFISLFVLLFGIYIGKIRITSDLNKQKDNQSFVFGLNILYKFRIFQVLIDILLLGAVYYFSYLIRFGGMLEPKEIEILKKSILLVIILKIILLNIFNVYKIDSKYFNFSDALKIIKSITIGSFLSVIIFTFWYRFQGYSRAVFIIDWMLGMLAVGVVKFSYRLFDELFYSFKRKNNIEVAFLGDRDNFKAIESFIRIKAQLKYRLKLFIKASEYKPGNLKIKDRINLLVIESKYRKRLNNEDLALLKKKDIEIYNLIDFLKNTLE